jgi:protein-L-isoaspartate(D-aspartate) O-methyltransferase
MQRLHVSMRNPEKMVDFARARKAMVDNQLRTSNITDRRLLAVMGQVPRERFVPAERQTLAYVDVAHVLLPGRSARALPSPAPFAKLVHLAGIRHTDRVLDLGCGTGYSTAVLAALCADVVALDDHADLIALARENLQELGISNATVVEAPLAGGAPGAAPFDVIVVEGVVDEVPAPLFEQLGDGGRLVALIRRGATAVANLFVKSGSDVAGRADFNASLPPLGGPAAADEFIF